MRPFRARRTVGPRFAGGYQFGDTNAARITPGEVLREERIEGKGFVQIVRMKGGQRCTFMVYRQGERELESVSSTSILYDELEARKRFADELAELARW